MGFAWLLLAAAPPPPPLRPQVMLMTGLPLVWGERGPFDPGSRPAMAYVELAKAFDLQPVDVLEAETLARGRLLLLAQPQRLAPAELAALDRWVRRGGRALILTDPVLTWPSELPPGDIRRPPPTGLLAPLLRHWGLALAAGRGGEAEERWNGRRVRLDSPGRFRSSGPHCIVATGGWMATCALGRGRAILVADADLLRDPFWTAGRSENASVVAGWLDELAGVPPPAREPVRWPVAAIATAAALAGIAGTGLLRRRRRKR